MNAEIIAIGTELLLGQIPNTNAQHISNELAAVGIDVYTHSVVGDNEDRIVEALGRALGRADVVILTGGLGPTPDDLTREAVARTLDVPLDRDEALVTEITGVFERLGRSMPEINLKQADIPRGATPITAEGTAPGFIAERDGRIVAALPGVPWEMKAMLSKAVLPLLRERAGAAAIVSRQILVVGLGESMTEEKISDIVAAQSNPTIAYLAGGGVVRVRITAKAHDDADALLLIAPVEEAIRTRLGRAAVQGHHPSLAAALIALLKARGATVGVAESLTGGLIATALTEAPGSSEQFKGSIVCYTNEAKRDLVGVDKDILSGPGPVSSEAAHALAEGAAHAFSADLGLGATGVAGPDSHDGMPPGTIFVSASLNGHTEVRQVKGYGPRANVQALAVTSALDLGRRLLED
ncbi:MAG TPA: competence/damage-inducible protein A [Actinomycetota bacterium]|nr:competence/damage-inducible protein A [Actinomycetota bacterium]